MFEDIKTMCLSIAVQPVKGGSWSISAIGNAEWSGARLSDVMGKCFDIVYLGDLFWFTFLRLESVDPDATIDVALERGLNHVHFTGLDQDESGTHYEVSWLNVNIGWIIYFIKLGIGANSGRTWSSITCTFSLRNER